MSQIRVGPTIAMLPLALLGLSFMAWAAEPDEWHGEREVIQLAAASRQLDDTPIASAVWDSSGRTAWILQMDCGDDPVEPQVLKLDVGNHQHTLSYVAVWSPSLPMIWHCARNRFPAIFDDATKNVVFFGGMKERELRDSPNTRRRYSTYRSVNFSSEVWSLDTNNSKWFEIPVAAGGSRPPARMRHGATWDQQGRRMWIFAGLGGDGNHNNDDLPSLNDLWEGQLNTDNSISWTMLSTHRTFYGPDSQLVWDPQRAAVWTLFKRSGSLQLWCYLTKQQRWREFQMGKLASTVQPAALVWHAKNQEILFLNGINSWIFSPSTANFRAPSVITPVEQWEAKLSDGRFVWDEKNQEAMCLARTYGKNPWAEMYTIRLHASCPQIFCPQGSLQREGSDGHTIADCCGNPCSSFLCPVGYEHIADAAWVVGETQDTCGSEEGTVVHRKDGAGVIKRPGADEAQGIEPINSGQDQTFLWVAVGAIALCIPVLLVNFYLLRKKFVCSKKRAAQQDAIDDAP